MTNLETLRELEESLWKEATRFDNEYMDEILAPDFFEFGRSGRTYGRNEIVNLPPMAINATFPLKDFKVHEISPDVALVTYISEDAYDTGLEVANRSSLWIKTPRGTGVKGWQLKFHQGTPTPK